MATPQSLPHVQNFNSKGTRQIKMSQPLELLMESEFNQNKAFPKQKEVLLAPQAHDCRNQWKPNGNKGIQIRSTRPSNSDLLPCQRTMAPLFVNDCNQTAMISFWQRYSWNKRTMPRENKLPFTCYLENNATSTFVQRIPPVQGQTTLASRGI